MKVKLKFLVLIAWISQPAFSIMENDTLVWGVRGENYPLLENSPWTIMTDGHGNRRVVLLKKLGSYVSSTSENWNVRFFLFTRKTTAAHEELITDDTVRLSATTFNGRLPVKVIIHGFLSYAFDDWVIRMKKYLLIDDDVNVICVDWSDHSNTAYYPSAVKSAAPVGQLVGQLLDFLAVQTSLSMKHVHLIGHSIGAHISAVAGRQIKYGSIARLSGLDPALPLFDLTNFNVTLSTDAADFVDCIHTCGGYFGIDTPICHADFYPNGGKMNQPGCGYWDLGTCSHIRSHDYFEESIIPKHDFKAYSCSTIPDDADVVCNATSALMGYPAKSWNQGIFYVKTGKSYPYSNSI